MEIPFREGPTEEQAIEMGRAVIQRRGLELAEAEEPYYVEAFLEEDDGQTPKHWQIVMPVWIYPLATSD